MDFYKFNKVVILRGNFTGQYEHLYFALKAFLYTMWTYFHS